MYKRFCKSFDTFGRLLGFTVGRFEKSSLLEPVRLNHAAPCTMLHYKNEAMAFVGKGQFGKPPS